MLGERDRRSRLVINDKVLDKKGPTNTVGGTSGPSNSTVTAYIENVMLACYNLRDSTNPFVLALSRTKRLMVRWLGMY